MNTATPAPGPLAGLRVIEMGSLLAGPFAGQLLGDFGAEVIKVEPPGQGDPMRVWGQHRPQGHSLWFPIIARNKKSVTLNLRLPEGQQLARELLSTADVLVENFRPGTLEGWGLGPDTLQQLNPGLVMLRVSGYGQTGPYRDRAGFGSIGEAVGGLRALTGEPGRPPVRVGVTIGDMLAGTLGALGTMMALYSRTTSGRGQVVDVALYEAVLTYMESLIPEFALAGQIRERSGSTLPGIAPSNIYPALGPDGQPGEWVVIGANADTVFRRLCAEMGRPELSDHPDYRGHEARGLHMNELDELIAAWTATLPADELVTTARAGWSPGQPGLQRPRDAAGPALRGQGQHRAAAPRATGQLPNAGRGTAPE
ncbi:CaiB/BaiF CoA transferase family protein [Deinococcus sonorensis]|uniref:CoA transferase n=1 Tax=Deinococcus sonorensis KR-87 TaxID=694439 RepID=A0AAU7UAD3_9DEIO